MVCRFFLTEQAVFADETGAHGKGFLGIFIVRRIISPEHRITVCVLFPCAEHKAVLFAVGCRQHGISECGKLSVIGVTVGFHLRGVFVESDIFSHRRKLILNSAELEKYFGKDKSPREMKDKIISLLDDWKAKQPPELGKPEKKTDLEK